MILDPRSKLFLLLLSNLLLFFHLTTIYEGMVMVLFLSLFFLAGKYKTGIKFSILYFILLFIDLYGVDYMKSGFLAIIATLAIGFKMMLPCIAMGTYIIGTTKTSEMLCALKKMKVSDKITIPLVVMIRFFPTVKEDYHSIRDAMSLRGICTDYKEMLLHPFKTLEYIIIPLLTNSSVVANDLTIAALTKGLTIDGVRSFAIELKPGALDYAFSLLCLIPFMLFFKYRYF